MIDDEFDAADNCVCGHPYPETQPLKAHAAVASRAPPTFGQLDHLYQRCACLRLRAFHRSPTALGPDPR